MRVKTIRRLGFLCILVIKVVIGFVCYCIVEGDRGREVYGRQEKRGREAGFLRWPEAGEKREKVLNTAQYLAIEKMQRGGSQKIQGGNRV